MFHYLEFEFSSYLFVDLEIFKYSRIKFVILQMWFYNFSQYKLNGLYQSINRTYVVIL